MIILINGYLLGHILVSIIRMKRSQLLKSKDSHYVNPYTVYILLFDFGVPWILYVMYINQEMAVVFSYIFILVNGTQVYFSMALSDSSTHLGFNLGYRTFC